MQKTRTKFKKAPSSQQPPAKNRNTAQQKQIELKIYGRHACETVWQLRPTSIIRVYVLETHLKDHGELLKWCASNRKAYHLVSKDDLAKITESVHHEGICFLVKQELPGDDAGFAQWLQQAPATSNLLFLDGTANPHNLGAVIRSAAHFGVQAIMLPHTGTHLLNSSMIRIARGGFERLKLFQLKHAEQALRSCQSQGYKIYATSSHFRKSIFETTLPSKSLFVLGNETTGISKNISALADETLLIPGTGLVESLNISVASALLMGEFYRQHTLKVRVPKALNHMPPAGKPV